MARTNKSVYLVLGLLAGGEKSGYDIKRDVEEVIGHFWKESYGQIYPVLSELARKGFIRRARSTGGGRRNVFSITARGREELERWLAEPAEPESVRNEMLLKVFFGHSVAPSVIVSHIEAFRARNEDFLATLRRGASELDDEELTAEARRAVELSLRLGELIAEARLQWAGEALRTLSRRRRPS